MPAFPLSSSHSPAGTSSAQMSVGPASSGITLAVVPRKFTGPPVAASDSRSPVTATLTGGSSPPPNSPMRSTVRSSPAPVAGASVTQNGVCSTPERVKTRKSSRSSVSGSIVCDSTTGMPSRPEAPRQRRFAVIGSPLSTPKNADRIAAGRPLSSRVAV